MSYLKPPGRESFDRVLIGYPLLRLQSPATVKDSLTVLARLRLSGLVRSERILTGTAL